MTFYGARRRMPAGRRRSRGQSLVEFTLVVPILLLLVSGMIDFGLGLNSYMTVIGATRDGARLGANACGTATPGCTAAIRSRVTTAATNSGLAVSVSNPVCKSPTNTPVACNSGAAKGGGSVTVTGSYTYHTIWPLAFGTTIPMSYSATFMVQ